MASWGGSCVVLGPCLAVVQKGSGGQLRGHASTRILADFWEASHSHIRHLRGCLALAILARQKAFVWMMASVAHLVWIVSFDEAQVACCADRKAAKRHLLMVHFLLAGRPTLADPLIKKQFVTAPAVLVRQTAMAIWNGLAHRSPISVLDLAQKAKRTMLIANSDSANACKSVGAHITGEIMKLRQPPFKNIFSFLYVLHVFCLMHQIALLINAVLALFNMVNPLYCSFCLMSSSTNLDAMTKKLRDLCRTMAVSSREEYRPTEAEIAYGSALLNLLEWGDDGLRDADTRSPAAVQRRERRARLAKFLSWRKGT